MVSCARPVKHEKKAAYQVCNGVCVVGECLPILAVLAAVSGAAEEECYSLTYEAPLD